LAHSGGAVHEEGFCKANELLSVNRSSHVFF
jgi:hypothetical protein